MNRVNISMKRMGLKDIDTFLLILVEFHWLLTASLGFGGRFLLWPFGTPVRFLAFAFMLARRILFLSCGDLGWCGSGCFLCSLSGSVKISPSFFANSSMMPILKIVISLIFALSVSSHTALYERLTSSFKIDLKWTELRCIPGQKQIGRASCRERV